MMKIHTSQIAAKVAARNAVNTAALALSPAMFAALAPFVGQKIILADGSLSAKVRAVLPPCGGRDCLMWYSIGYGYTLTVTFKTSANYAGHNPGDQFATYAEQAVYLANIKSGVLDSIMTPPALRTDYTIEEVLQARQELKVAQGALSVAQSKLSGFGEYDN